MTIETFSCHLLRIIITVRLEIFATFVNIYEIISLKVNRRDFEKKEKKRKFKCNIYNRKNLNDKKFALSF